MLMKVETNKNFKNDLIILEMAETHCDGNLTIIIIFYSIFCGAFILLE